MSMLFKRTKVNNRKNYLSLYWGLKRIYFGKLGFNVRIIPQGSFFGNAKNIYISDNVFLGRETYMDAVSEICIGAGTMVGPRCTFIGSTHNYDSPNLKSLPYDDLILDRKIIVERNVWIAAGVTVCPGTHIGEGAVIGAGACVYGNIPPFSVVVSNGYKIIKERNREKYKELAENDAIYNKIFAGKPFVKKEEL